MSIKNGKGANPYQLQKTLDRYLKGFDFIKPLNKRQRILALLVVSSRAGIKLNRFHAQNYGDSVFPNTVRDIGIFYGVDVSRENVSFVSKHGLTHCCRYWLSDDATQRAEAVLMQLSRGGS